MKSIYEYFFPVAGFLIAIVGTQNGSPQFGMIHAVVGTGMMIAGAIVIAFKRD